MSTKPMWHNCVNCGIHYFSDEPQLKANMCDECWNKVPQFVVKTRVEKEMEPINWKVWITLYSSMAMAVIAIIGYRLWS